MDLSGRADNGTWWATHEAHCPVVSVLHVSETRLRQIVTDR